jgi:RNA polymerase sigma-70 factor (ECF subfamily)
VKRVLLGILSRLPQRWGFFMQIASDDAWSERSHALAALLARVALGDRAAFATLYEKTSAHLLGVILRIEQDRALAEDVLQEVFINVWHAAQSFEAARAQPLTWLTSIARNRAIDGLRRRKTQISTVSNVQAGDDDEDEVDVLAHLPSPQPGPLELLEEAAQQQQVQHCVAALSEEQRQCVALAYYQGLSHAEVASHLSQPLGSVKSWVRRALLALKDCLGRAAGLATSRH